MTIAEVVALVSALGGAGAGLWGGYTKLAANIAKSKAEAGAALLKAEGEFRDVLIEREERCRAENHELRNEVMTVQGRLLVVERSAMLAEVHLEVRGKLDQVLDHFGITPVIRPVQGELTHG